LRRVIDIELTWPEILIAAHAGVMRYVNALRKARQEFDSHDDQSWDGHINGCIAEMAVAKHLGLFWSGTVGIVDAPDVGKLQVRSKRFLHHHLCIKRRDKDSDTFVCVLVDHTALPFCVLTGWMAGREAKLDHYIGKHGLFYVPDKDLHPMEMLSHEMAAA
jgi:hypothetical protein